MDARMTQMAEILINYSLAVKPGERVLPAAEPLVQALYQAGLRAGGEIFTYIHLHDTAGRSNFPDGEIFTRPFYRISAESRKILPYAHPG